MTKYIEVNQEQYKKNISRRLKRDPSKNSMKMAMAMEQFFSSEIKTGNEILQVYRK